MPGKLHRLRHSLITTLSGTIEKDGAERTIRKEVDHRNELRQKAINGFIADKMIRKRFVSVILPIYEIFWQFRHE
jgi:hypothetical protein